MSGSYGYATKLGISAANPTDARFDFQSESLGVNEQFVNGNGLRGTRSPDVSRVRQGNRPVGGQIRLQPNSAELALLLPWILGANASGNTYALADTLQDRYVQVDRVAKVFTYNGVKVDKATLRGQQGQPLDLILDLVGIDETVGNSGTFPATSIDTANGPFLFTDGVFSVAGTNYAAKEIEIVVDNKIDRERFFNSQTLTTVNATDRETTVKTSLPYGDATAVYNTGAGGVAFVGTFTNGNAVLTLSLVKACFPRRSPQTQGKQEIMLPLEGIAYQSGNTKEIVVTLVVGP